LGRYLSIMEIVISESQYKNLLLEYENLTPQEMEEYFVLYFESLERYQDMIKKLLWVRSYTQIKNVDFYWNPRLNSEDYKSFAYRARFFNNRPGVFQFSFTNIVKEGIYDGEVNGFINVQAGMSVYKSVKLTAYAFDYNYSIISSYLKEFLKDPAFKDKS
jgi:hypothetical protein